MTEDVDVVTDTGEAVTRNTREILIRARGVSKRFASPHRHATILKARRCRPEHTETVFLRATKGFALPLPTS